MSSIPVTLDDQIVDLYHHVAELRRRDRNRKRTGEVTEVDVPNGVARVQLTAEGRYAPFKTGWIPWREVAAGTNRTHQPPSVGQQVSVLSENGDLSDAEIDMSIPSEANPRPSQSGDEYILSQVGDTVIKSTADGVLIETGTLTLRASAVRVEKA